MTDEQIIKAFSCCNCVTLEDSEFELQCNACPYNGIQNKCDNLEHEVLDLINRQKAEIEALQMDNQQLQSDIINENQNYDHIKGLWEVEKEKVEKAKQKVINVCKELQTAKAEIERLEDKLYGYERTKHEVLFQFERKVHEELELLLPAHFLNPLQENMPITEVARLVDHLLHIVCMEVIHSVARNEFIKDMKEDGILPVKEMTEQKG